MRNEVLNVAFLFNVSRFTERECRLCFRLQKTDTARVMPVIEYVMENSDTKRNRYYVKPIFSVRLVFKRIEFATMWPGLICLFGKCLSQLSDILWEAIEHCFKEMLYLVSHICRFCAERAEKPESKTHETFNGLNNVLGIVVGTVLHVARPKCYVHQLVVLNDPKP